MVLRCDGKSRRLSETTFAWAQRSQLLEGGEGVEALSPAELKRLISLLTVEINSLDYLFVLSYWEV